MTAASENRADLQQALEVANEIASLMRIIDTKLQEINQSLVTVGIGSNDIDITAAIQTTRQMDEGIDLYLNEIFLLRVAITTYLEKL